MSALPPKADIAKHQLERQTQLDSFRDDEAM
jgi:hypothetical protein